MITVKEFKERREKLYSKMSDGSVLLLYCGVPKKKSYDEDYPFQYNKNFYYLTNIKQEESVLLVTKNNGIINEFLFIQEYSELKEKWTGIRLTAEEARKISGINNVMYLNTFDAQLNMVLDKNNRVYGDFDTLYMDLEPENKVAQSTTTNEIKERLVLNYSNIHVEDIYKTIVSLRGVKSAQEIEEFKAAISKTNIGLNKIIKNIKPGMKEWQLAALFEYTIKDIDNCSTSFNTIAASGKNAVILHYPHPLGELKDGDLMLFDLGAQNNGYCADISRTYPINGKFSELQKTIYSIVLDCNKMIIKTAKPGITLNELNEKCKEFLARRCLEHGLIQNLEEISRVYYHGVSHPIGLDTHDPMDRSEPLVSGNVISDEPGLYFKELGIGVRIEDDLLITDDGCYCLSGNIIKEIADIEKAMMFKE